MSIKNSAEKSVKQNTGADLRAMAEARMAAQADPAATARQREASFLRNVTAAGDDLEWILLNRAWTRLGFEHLGDWWERRVLPVLEKLDLRPSPALVEKVVRAISADERSLPGAQRRTQRELAAITKTSQAKVSRSLSDTNESGSDLEEAPKSPIVAAVRQAIEDAGRSVDACEKCSGPIDPDQAVQGYARCDDCDPDGDHVRPELDDGRRGPCAKCLDEAAEQDAQNLARQEDAARRLRYFESGALKAVGPVKHFADVDCAAAENAEETPLWATEISKTTCLDCLRAVAHETAAGSSSDRPADGAQPGQWHGAPAGGGLVDSEPVPGNPEDSSMESAPVDALAGRPLTSDTSGDVETVAIDRPGIEPPVFATGEEPTEDGVGSPVASAATSPVSGQAGDEVEDGPDSPPDGSSSTDPEAFVTVLEGWVDQLDRVDVDALGPLMTDDLLARAHLAADNVAWFVGLLDRWRNK